jgi:hypothetical protein
MLSGLAVTGLLRGLSTEAAVSQAIVCRCFPSLWSIRAETRRRFNAGLRKFFSGGETGCR